MLIWRMEGLSEGQNEKFPGATDTTRLSRVTPVRRRRRRSANRNEAWTSIAKAVNTKPAATLRKKLSNHHGQAVSFCPTLAGEISSSKLQMSWLRHGCVHTDTPSAIFDISFWPAGSLCILLGVNGVYVHPTSVGRQ